MDGGGKLMSRLASILFAFGLGLVLYLLLGETGLVSWHKDQGLKAAFRNGKSMAAESAPASIPARTGLVLNSFESKDQCRVGVDGYTEVEMSGQKVSEGEHSLKAVFLLRDQFYSTPTPGPSPVPGRPAPAGSASPTASPSPTPAWRPRILFGIGSPVPLKTQDFSAYRSLKLDVFNPEERPINAYLEIADARGYVFTLPATGLSGQKISTLGADLPDLASQDLDLKKIRHIAFHVDVSGRGSPPVLYLDNLRLER